MSTVTSRVMQQSRRITALGLALLLTMAVFVAGAAPAQASTHTSEVFVSDAPNQQIGRCTAQEIRASQRWWMFGGNVKLDFGVTGTAAPKVSHTTGGAGEGSTVVTDTEGNLRFWSNGIAVWGADGNWIKNSEGGLGMSSSAQTVVAMPAIGAPGKYYVVTSGYMAEMGDEKALLYYSVIDMNANGGKGEMIEKNIPLGTPGVAGEGLVATANAAGDGFWVYALAANSNKIHRWEFKADGPVSTTPQSQSTQSHFTAYSTIHFDQRVGSDQGVVLSAGENIYTMVTVNRSTGLLTEGHRVKHWSISGTGRLYGAAFSPSGRYMFFSELHSLSPNPRASHVYRVDLSQDDTASQLRDSRIDLGPLSTGPRSGGAVKLGPDGNIWVNDGYLMPTIVKITNPDAATPGGLQRVRIDVEPGMLARYGLPDMVTGCEKRIPQMSATITTPAGLTLGDEIDPVTVTLTNTGNTELTGITAPTGLDTCPATSLDLGESMTCTASPGHWGTVTQAHNAAGEVKNVAWPITATGSIGADPSTGVERSAQITVTPVMDVKVITTWVMTFDMNGLDSDIPDAITKRDSEPWGTLPTVSGNGVVFLGWHTTTAGGTEVTSSTAATSDVTVYAQWRPAQFNIVFDSNPHMGAVTGSMGSMTVDSGCDDCALPANGFTKTTGAPLLIEEGSDESAEVNSTFLGWSLDPLSQTGDIADQANAGALSTTDGDTVTLYAVWDDAPQFIVAEYPHRFFSLEQAQNHDITEAELLSTVTATDRETNPLQPKTAAQVSHTGSDVGITLYDYDADDYTSLTAAGSVSLTYKVKDEVGNVAFLRINVSVSDGTPTVPAHKQYLRGISNDYLSSAPGEGGLPADSLWRTDPTREAALAEALNSTTGQVTYCLDATTITQLREQMGNAGLGNAQMAGALSAVADTLSTQAMCE